MQEAVDDTGNRVKFGCNAGIGEDLEQQFRVVPKRIQIGCGNVRRQEAVGQFVVDDLEEPLIFSRFLAQVLAPVVVDVSLGKTVPFATQQAGGNGIVKPEVAVEEQIHA